MLSSLLDRLDRFRRDDDGSVSIEALIMFPVLAWVFLACFVYSDGFQSKAINVKSTYTIADILSREVNQPITPEYLDSVYALYQIMSRHEAPQMLRVTAIQYYKADDKYHVVWSEVRGTGSKRDDASLAAIRATTIPNMYDGEVGLMVETQSRYTPAFPYVGMWPFDIRNTMILRPRFAALLCWSTSNDGPWTAANQTCS